MRIHKTEALVGAAVLMLSAGGCESEHRAGAANKGEVDIAAIKEAITADQEKWNEDYHARPKDADRLMSHYASDAYIVTSGVERISGKWNIRSLMGAVARDPNFDMTFAGDRIEVANSGDLAFVRGRFSARYTDPSTNQVKSETGTYLTVYKKQDDSSWKAIEDFSVHDAGPQRPPR